MEQFDLRYREGLPLVLKQISCDIKPGEKVHKQAGVIDKHVIVALWSLLWFLKLLLPEVFNT